MALAGRASEEVVLGKDELSSLNQHRLMFARQVGYAIMMTRLRCCNYMPAHLPAFHTSHPIASLACPPSFLAFLSPPPPAPR
jgi:hypothetical protein